MGTSVSPWVAVVVGFARVDGVVMAARGVAGHAQGTLTHAVMETEPRERCGR